MLYAKVETPSQTTVSWDIKEIYGISKVHVGEYLQVHRSRYLLPLHLTLVFELKNYLGCIHLGFDGWTSPNIFSFLGVVVHIAPKGELQSFILDFIS